MGTKRVGLARTQALIQNLKRELTMNGSTMVGVKRKHLQKTAGYTCVAADSGAILQVNPADTTLIQLPAAANNAGWYITIIIDESDGGTLDQKVNIGTESGEFFTGTIWCTDGGGNSNANGTSNDFITCSTNSQSGLRFEIHSDGTRMHATGWAVDASDTLFADAAG